MIKTAVKFALFVVVCLAFTLWLGFTIGNVKLFKHDYTLTATFDDVTGLLPDDNVKIAGVVVGKVTGIKVVDGRAKVTFTVDEKYKVPSDSYASIRWRNLIGQRYVYLYAGQASTMLSDGDGFDEHCTATVTTRCTKDVIDLGELFNKLGPIVQALDSAKANQFLDTITQALDGNQAKVSKAIDDLATLATGLAARDQTIGSLIENLNTVAGTITNRDAQIRTMLDNLVLISQTFSDNTLVLDQALSELSQFSGDLDFLLTDNAAEIDRLITNLDLVVQTVGAKLPTIDHALAGIAEGSKHLFNAGRLGEWLNQDILCFAAGPPTGSTACELPFETINDLGSVLGPSAAAAPAPARSAAIGDAAQSNAAGAEALEALVLRGLPAEDRQ